MKRYLLFVIAFVCVSIGAWADPINGNGYKLDDGPAGIGEWFLQKDASLGTEKVIKVEVSQTGGLKGALDELTSILNGQSHPGFLNKLNEGGTYVADKKLVLQVVNTSGSPLTLNADDLAALASIDIPTIDLQDLNPASTFTFANPNVKRVILPDGWDKAAVNAAGEALKTSTNFESALSQDGANGAVVAYVNKPGTLYTAMRHTYGATAISKLGDQGPYNFSLGNLHDFTLLGTPSARDFNGAADQPSVKFDDEGHFVFDREADETKKESNAGIGGTRQLVGTQMAGAIVGAQLARLDLGDAIITNDHCSDLTISWSYSAVSTSLKEIIFPTTDQLWTLPADCLNGDYQYLEEFCIPGNIRKLKTRSCLISTRVLRHVWTTGTNENLIYDNGAYTVDSDGKRVFDHYGYKSEYPWNCQATGEGTARFGTITLPEKLELIESNCFTAQNISDVYSLNPVAPECHVDAFSTIMYLGNNTIDTDYIVDQGMVTREAYAQNVMEGQYISFLHYPTNTGTPNIQRYTDPTREFSIATTMRDGKGNVIYFPNQSELNRAYIQGTTGYLWYAWDSERVPEEHGGDANSFVKFSDGAPLGGHTTAIQELANTQYANNQMTNPDKTDRTFYDVRLDGDGQPSLEKPSDLQWYYDQYRSGHQLYPQMAYETSNQQIGEVHKLDANGNPIYEVCPNGNYVKDQHYVPNAEGTYVNVPVFNGYVSTTTSVPEIDTYYSDNQGQEETTPKVAGSFYFKDGTKPVYTAVDKNNDAIGAQDQYYKKNGDVYTPSNLMFSNNTTYYYYSEEGQVKGWVQEWGYVNENANHYTSPDFSGTPIKKGDQGFDWNALYWVYYPDVIHYIASDHFIPGKTWYSYDQNNKTYTAITLNWHQNFDGADYYYVSDNVPNYSSANGQDYSAYEKYYTDAAGETEATTVNFDNTYYYASYTDNFVTYTDQEGQRYNLVDYYREATEADGSAQRYCPDMEPVYGITKNEKTKDYRGWHQFVLAAYAPFGDPEEVTVVKFYQTDSDWWTVCLPYDLTYSEMIRFFGNSAQNKIPYLSKLRYVVRDYDKENITLVFSKNLMEYKEVITNDNPLHENVHGIINDKTKYTNNELAQDPIILHKGVPYMIKPEIPRNANRSFEVYKNTENGDKDLYKRLVDAENVPAAQLETYIYEGEYTVPAYVVGTNAPEATVDSRTFSHYYYNMTYNSADQIMYGGQEVQARVSNDFSYTFVGSFFKSVLPQYCYFLGWDSKKGCAAFWYNKVPKLDKQEWNNQTGIILANFNHATTIDPATSLADPARWIIKAPANSSDDLLTTLAGAPRNYGMTYGGAINILVDDSENPLAEDFGDQDVLSIDEIQSLDAKSVWYNVSGQKLNGRPTQSGVYIMNGKKYVVK